MELKVLKEEKDNIVVEIDNQTVAELLRVYLNEDDSVVLAAWKREHPEEPVIFEVQTKGKAAKKAIEDAAAKIEKDTDKILDDFKKALK
jgi:DNA-directed RNA polymerase subunit L